MCNIDQRLITKAGWQFTTKFVRSFKQLVAKPVKCTAVICIDTDINNWIADWANKWVCMQAIGNKHFKYQS